MTTSPRVINFQFIVLLFVCLFEYGIISTLGGRPQRLPPSSKDHLHQNPHHRDKKGAEGRVLWGKPIEPNEFPPLVGIYDLPNGQQRLKCGGTIIDRHWIMSSAYCFLYETFFIPQNLSDFTIVAGDHNKSVRERWEQHVKVVDVIINQNYELQLNSWAADIALARVEPPFRFNSKVYPANLPGCNSTPPAGTNLTLVGWGTRIWGTGNKSDVPTKGEVTLVFPETECTIDDGLIPISESRHRRKAKGSQRNEGRVLAKHILCSSNNAQIYGHGPCNGDNGTPLFLRKGKGHLVIAGFVTGPSGQYQENCGDLPFVYTDVSAYDGWIRRRLSGCGNYPQSRFYFIGNNRLSRKPN